MMMLSKGLRNEERKDECRIGVQLDGRRAQFNLAPANCLIGSGT